MDGRVQHQVLGGLGKSEALQGGQLAALQQRPYCVPPPPARAARGACHKNSTCSSEQMGRGRICGRCVCGGGAPANGCRWWMQSRGRRA